MLVDLDRFSTLNESLGASSADLVLLEVARRLRQCLRQGDVAARIGGDQFALLIHGADVPSAETAAKRVLQAVSATTQVGNLSFTLTCSIGVAVSPLHGRGLDELLAGADEAMRRAKQGGRATWRMHSLRRATDPRVSIRMDHAMRQALANNRFRVCYQPQVDIASGAVVGAEALLRWHDPEFGGEVSPARFIPVAEDSGLIIALGDWVLRQTLRQAALWHGAGLDIPVAVNVSALQFHQPGFSEQVANDLRHCKLPPHLLELEVTESLLLRDADDTLARLQALAALGVRLSIDDFGTGYSNLAYLKRLPLTQLKIDRSFITGLPGDTQDAGIVTAILQLARALGIEAIAEGVEKIEQHQFLKKAGCERFQGFLFAPALDAARFEARWRTSRLVRAA
jgi:diguanylate cyclase (GGDEF)-like protein